MNDFPAYTYRQTTFAINLSAFLGWAMIGIPISIIAGEDFVGILGFFFWAAILGLPIAFISSWMIAAPILRHAMQNSLTWVKAGAIGGLIAFLIALAGICFRRLYGWSIYLDPTQSYQIGGGDFIQEIDGILTPYGWIVLGVKTGLFVLGGIAVSMIVRAIIGPGKHH